MQRSGAPAGRGHTVSCDAEKWSFLKTPPPCARTAVRICASSAGKAYFGGGGGFSFLTCSSSSSSSEDEEESESESVLSAGLDRPSQLSSA